MDELVKQALAKWPDVPDCYGWLALDGRGRWRIGPQRETITHTPMIDYINRNYLADDDGCWFFQNGPQRVFVELDFTPFVWRLVAEAADDGALVAHTGEVALTTSGVWLIGDGRFLIEANQRVGVLHDHDSAIVLERLCDAQGARLSESDAAEKLAELSTNKEEEQRDAPATLYVRLPGCSTPLPLGHIAAADIARRFRFESHPAPRATPPG